MRADGVYTCTSCFFFFHLNDAVVINKSGLTFRDAARIREPVQPKIARLFFRSLFIWLIDV